MSVPQHKSTVLDHIEDIRVEGEPFAEPANEYAALLALRVGMDFLYRFAAKCDATVIGRLDPKKQFGGWGNLQQFEGIPLSLLTCAFHWYSISACQYAKTVGAIAYRQDSSRPKPQGYAMSVIPDVLTFRDKIGAHFAWNTLNSNDSEAERLASIMPPVSFERDSFCVVAYRLTVRRKGQSSSTAFKPWSITKTHRSLQVRYWPEEAEHHGGATQTDPHS